jgi:glycosyltransferase involved in cell wall biosynthesis
MESVAKLTEMRGKRERQTPVVSLVMPFYNPGPSLLPTVKETISVVSDLALPFEIIAVCDGSTDGSDKELDSITDERFKLIRRTSNSGKGSAIRDGFALAKGDYVGFMDADGDIDPKVLPIYLDILVDRDCDVLIGSKHHPDSKVSYPKLRRLYSFAYQRLVRGLFGISVTDTQVGLKFVKRSLYSSVAPSLKETGFVFDLELLLALDQLDQGVKIVEAPVWIRPRVSSTIDLRAVAGIAKDTYRVYRRRRYLVR